MIVVPAWNEFLGVSKTTEIIRSFTVEAENFINEGRLTEAMLAMKKVTKYTNQMKKHIEKEQQAKRSRGKSADMTYKEACEQRGVKYNTFAYRYYQLGWTLENALNPIKSRADAENYSYKGETGTLRYFAKKYNITHNALYGRINRGWSIEKSIEIPTQKKATRNQ